MKGDSIMENQSTQWEPETIIVEPSCFTKRNLGAGRRRSLPYPTSTSQQNTLSLFAQHKHFGENQSSECDRLNLLVKHYL